MKTIRFGKKEDSTVIDIENMVEDGNEIYCYKNNANALRFLFRKNGLYYWTTLSLSNNMIMFTGGYKSLVGALKDVHSHGNKVYIFDSQCEVLEYAKRNFSV